MPLRRDRTGRQPPTWRAGVVARPEIAIEQCAQTMIRADVMVALERQHRLPEFGTSGAQRRDISKHIGEQRIIDFSHLEDLRRYRAETVHRDNIVRENVAHPGVAHLPG